MIMHYDKPVSREIKRRTFEGKTDPAKNDNSLTSKYMPSYRYWMEITYDTGRVSETCKVTKRDCIEYFEACERMAGKPL